MLEKKQTLQKPSKKQYLKYGLSVGRIILQEVATTIEWIMKPGYGGWCEYQDNLERQRQYEERQRRYEEKEWIRSLKHRKFIETKRVGKKLMIRLTKKGWQQALRDKIKCTRACCKKGICIVIFDVPESEKHTRNALRNVLAQCGFIMLQKSVWYTDKDVLKELCALLQGAGLEKWVKIIIGDEVQSSAIGRASTRLITRTKKSARRLF